MKILLVTVIGLVATTFALPQYGSSGQFGTSNGDKLTGGNRPNLPAGCRIQYKTVYDIVENEKFETKCTEKYRSKCTEKYNRVCTPYTENICKTAYETKCETKYKDNCYEVYRDKQESYVEDVCVDKDVAVCDKHWECKNPNLPLSDCNDKVWVDNKASCKYLKKSFCEKVQCVSWQNCNDVPYEKCDPVTLEDCNNVPYNDCKQVPYQDCRQVHSKVPEQVSHKRPFRVCDGGNEPYRYTDQEIADYDFVELRTGAVDPGLLDKKQIEETTTKKSSSAITFG